LPPPSTQPPFGGARCGAAAPRGKAIRPIPGAKKSPWGDAMRRPYRKPTQVGGGKYPKVDGRTLVKELGKIVP
jgi:hypothetical protein